MGARAVAPWDGALCNGPEDVRAGNSLRSQVAHIGLGPGAQPRPLGAPQVARGSSIGCLRGVEGVISRGLVRAYDRGRRERFLCGDGGVLNEQSRKPSKKILAERAATIQIIHTYG